MRVWTDGGVHVIAGEAGVEVHRPKVQPVLHPFGKRAQGGGGKRDVLAVLGREPLRAWVGNGRAVRLYTLEGEPSAGDAIDAYVLDAVGLGDGRVLACVAGTGERRARLVVVADGGAADLTVARELALPAATRIAWPGGIWAEEAVPWPEDDADDDDEPTALDVLALGAAQRDGLLAFDEVVCSPNEHGIAVTGVYCGLVAVLPPDASRVDFVVRVPTQVGETEILAARTPQGVVVVLCIEGRHSAVLHIAPDGKVIAHAHTIGRDLAWGMGPPVVQGDRVVVFETGQRGEDRLDELSLPDLTLAKSVELGERPTGRVSAWTAPGGVPFILGLGARACVVKRGGRGRVTRELLERPLPPEPPRPVAPIGPPLAQGAPSLALARAANPVPWELTVGQAHAIEISFTNQGGAGRGVAFEIGGAALQSGLVRVERASVGDAEVQLATKGGSARGDLAAAMLPAGWAVEGPPSRKGPPPPVPIVHIARFHLVGAKVGSAVLTVRITPLGAQPGRGSVLQGKSITVREKGESSA